MSGLYTKRSAKLRARIDEMRRKSYMDRMVFATTNIGPSGTADDTSAVDRLVLAVVNAPYKRDITASVLAQCVAHADIDPWPVHVASFFTDLPLDLVFGFASAHAIPKSTLAKTYRVMKAKTGEQNPDFEAALVAVASASQ